MPQADVRFDVDKRSVAAATFACACNVLSLILTVYLIHGTRGLIELSYQEVVVEAVWLAPSVVLIIFQRFALVTFTYALALFVILAGRLYDVAQFQLFGPAALPKFTWADLLAYSISAFSLFVVFLWGANWLTNFLFDTVKRIIGAGRDG